MDFLYSTVTIRESQSWLSAGLMSDVRDLTRLSMILGRLFETISFIFSEAADKGGSEVRLCFVYDQTKRDIMVRI
jgi:hypothetical protein